MWSQGRTIGCGGRCCKGQEFGETCGKASLQENSGRSKRLGVRISVVAEEGRGTVFMERRLLQAAVRAGSSAMGQVTLGKASQSSRKCLVLCSR